MIRARLVGLTMAMMTAGWMLPAHATAQEMSQTQNGGAPTIPMNVQSGAVLTPVVRQLLEHSSTFREQCGRIAAAGYLRISIEPVNRSRSFQVTSARTTIRRYASGAMVAEMEIPTPLTLAEYAQFLAHEFEHILEQVDGVDLIAVADAGTGATLLADGAYETLRARRAGQLAAAEVEGPAALDPVVRAFGRASKALRDAAGAPERRSIGSRW